MLGYTFIVMLRPGPENVRSLSYHVSNSPLFRTVLSLMFHQQKKGEQGLLNCSDLFESVLETSMADCERNSFYSLTPASYVIGLPSLFKPVIMKQPFIGYVHQFLKRVAKLDAQYLTHGQLCFIAEMYKTLCQCLNSETASLYPADFINGVLLPHARNQIQLVLQHKDVLSPEVYYAVLMLEQRLESNAFLQAVSRGAGKMMESLSFRQEDVAMIFNSLATMALDLKPFYREGQ